jgi:hypothetical protein
MMIFEVVNLTAYLKLLVIILVITIGVIGSTPLFAESRKDALVAAGIDGTCKMDAEVIKRYNIFPGYAECGQLLDLVKEYNPSSIVTLYNSGSDNYTTPGVTRGNYYGSVEHNWMVNRCRELGYSPEILYMHFYEDTELSGWSIPGTYSKQVSDCDSLARVPDYLTYYKGNGVGRIMINFAHPVTRQIQIEYSTMLMDSLECSMWKHLNGRTEHFDGIYLDNWMHNQGRRGYGPMGRIDTGGRIMESPNSSLIYGTAEFASWYWDQMKLFSSALRDTLVDGALWTPDKRRKYLAVNVGESWKDEYANPNITGADFLVMEFLYSPVKYPNTSIFGIEGMASKDSMCSENGVSIVYCSRQIIGEKNEFTWGEAIYNNLASFYVITSGQSYFFQRAGIGSPYAAQQNEHFDSLTWRDCMDYDLGKPLEHYSVYKTGRDPRGQSYKVFARQYENGLVLIRPLDSWGQKFDKKTEIKVKLENKYRKLEINGSLSTAVSDVNLQNGAGAILIPVQKE